jgi:hypothetical protein
VVGSDSCTRTTCQKLQRSSITQFRPERPTRLCNRLRRWDGEFRWHHARGEPLRDREGRIVQWCGVSVDIDEGKKVEDRLRRSEAYLAESQRLSHTGTRSSTMQRFSTGQMRLIEFSGLIRLTGCRGAKLRCKRSIPMTENGCRRRPGEGYARRETISSSTDSYSLQPSNISKRSLILSSQQAENLWRL